MNVLSLFSGVGGFDLGLEKAGMKTVFQCELDKHATSVLKYHWPAVPKWADVSTLTGKYVLEHAPVIDVVAWGSPCQDLSIAGKRAGLAGSKSSLFYQGMRVIKEIQEETNGKYPKVSIWENVNGALSSNQGADFGVIIDAMAEAGALAIEWAVLDAQNFGVPQRRRRVFVVAIFDSATAAKCPDPLLPVAESLRRNTNKGKQTRESAASKTATSVEENSVFVKRKRAKTKTDYESWASNRVAPTLNAFDQGDKRTTVLAVESPAPILIDRAAFNQEKNALYHPRISDNPVAPSLVAKGPHAVAYSIREDAKANNFSATELDHANCLSALQPSTQSHHAQMFIAEPTMAVRRLTPLECERLMGWPDDHTKYKSDGSEQSDAQRYKQCGNGVASPVAEWVGKHIISV